MVVASDLKWYYSQGPASGRPIAGSTDHVALGAHSLGGAPRPAVASNEIPAFSGSEINLNALWDDTLEDENAGSSGTTVNYRCVYLWNAADDTDDNGLAVEALRTIYRAKLYAPRDLDANTAFAFSPLPLADATGAPTAGEPDEAKIIANETTVPQGNTSGSNLNNTTLYWRDVPETAAAAIFLRPAVDASATAPTTINLIGARYLGIWFRRTVTKVATPTGKIESITPTVIGGTPTA